MCASAGIVGFDTDMGATRNTQQADDTSGTIATVRAGMQEIEARWGQPFRHIVWKYLLPVYTTSCLDRLSAVLGDKVYGNDPQ